MDTLVTIMVAFMVGSMAFMAVFMVDLVYIIPVTMVITKEGVLSLMAEETGLAPFHPDITVVCLFPLLQEETLFSHPEEVPKLQGDYLPEFQEIRQLPLIKEDRFQMMSNLNRQLIQPAIHQDREIQQI